MSRVYPLLLALFFVASTVEAQDSSHHELGIIVGLTVLADTGSTLTQVGVPAGGGALGPGAFYIARVMRPWIFEFHFALNHLSGRQAKVTQRYLAVQGSYLLLRKQPGGPYLFANIAYVSLSGDLKQTENVVGGGLGYRLPLEKRLALRLEARYRRWLESDLHEYGILVGAGVGL